MTTTLQTSRRECVLGEDPVQRLRSTLTALTGTADDLSGKARPCHPDRQLRNCAGAASPELPGKLVQMSLLARDDEANRDGMDVLAITAAARAAALGTAGICTPSLDGVDAITPRTLQPVRKSHDRQDVHVAGVIIRIHWRQAKASDVQSLLQPRFVDGLLVADAPTASGDAVPFFKPGEDTRHGCARSRRAEIHDRPGTIRADDRATP